MSVALIIAVNDINTLGSGVDRRASASVDRGLGYRTIFLLTCHVHESEQK